MKRTKTVGDVGKQSISQISVLAISWVGVQSVR